MNTLKDGQSTHSHSQKPEIANWNLPERRKSPIEQLLERHNLGHISQNLNQAAQNAQNGIAQQPTQNGGPPLRPGQFQSALGITPTTLQSLYANPVFHQSLRTSVLQSRGLNPQTLPLLLPQQNSILNSQPKVGDHVFWHEANIRTTQFPHV